MRLTCPKCDAQYEIPDDAIPTAGREVQCSNCTHAWLQTPKPMLAAVPKSAPVVDLSDSSFEADQPAQPRRRALDPSVANILQQEAAFAAGAAQAETASNPRAYPLREEINAAIEDSVAREDDFATARKKAPKRRQKKGGSFTRGFSVMIIFVSLFVAPYVFAPQITQALPQAEPYLAVYIDLVDQSRLGLNALANQVMAMIDSFTGGATDSTG